MGTKISALTEDTTPTSDDFVVGVDDFAGTPANTRISISNLSKAVVLDNVPEGSTNKLLTAGERTIVGNQSGTNTGDQTLPVKATGAEVDTGTDDAKFTTAKALKDSKNVPSVVPSTDGNVLTSDGTDWVSETPAAGGGGNPYGATYVISSTGDYATLNAYAVDSPANGDVIYIAEDTTEIATSTIYVSDLTIICKKDAVVTMGAYNLTFLTGTGLHIKSLNLSFVAGDFGDDQYYSTIENLTINATGDSRCTFSGWYSNITDLRYTNTYGAISTVSVTGKYIVLDRMQYNGPAYHYTAGTVTLSGAYYSKIINSTFNFTVVRDQGIGIGMLGGLGCELSGNTIICDNDDHTFAIQVGQDQSKIVNNSIYNGRIGIKINGLDYGQINNNSIYNVEEYGIQIYDPDCTYTTINNNVIFGQAKDTNTGIYINQGDYLTIVGNVVTDCTLGIYISSANSDENVIMGNQLNNNTTALTDNGTGTIKDIADGTTAGDYNAL